MIRKIFKNMGASDKVKPILEKYKIPAEYLSVNRKMTSKAVLIGLFIAFIPMPMQMVAVMMMMPFMKFNVPIGLLMCWITNPFTMPLIYYVEYKTGSFLLGSEVMPVQMSVEWFSANLQNIFVPLYTGAFVFSVVFSVSSYYLINHFWKSSVDKNKKLHFKDRD